MTRREELKGIENWMYANPIDSDQASKLIRALKAAWQRIEELEQEEYICKRCGLRKDGEDPSRGTLIEF